MNRENELKALKEEIVKLSNALNEIKNEKKEVIEKAVQEHLPNDLISDIKKIAQKINLEEIKEKIPEDKIEEVKEKSKKVVDSVEEFAKNHPFLTVLGAFGIGYLIGKIKK